MSADVEADGFAAAIKSEGHWLSERVETRQLTTKRTAVALSDRVRVEIATSDRLTSTYEAAAVVKGDGWIDLSTGSTCDVFRGGMRLRPEEAVALAEILLAQAKVAELARDAEGR